MIEMPSSISPSRMSNFLGCPFRFYAETIRKLPQKTSAAALRGTTGHAALEALMNLPPDERTPERLAELVEVALEEVKETDEYRSLDADELKDFDAFVRRVAPRAFDVMDLPATQVEATEMMLEVDLDGWTLRGIIDLLVHGPAVDDWKFGRAPSERYQAKSMLGIDFYALMIFLHLGLVPRTVSLRYLESRLTISKEPSERSVRAMRSKVLAVRDGIARACEREDFRPNPSKLCDWCSAKPYCPAHGGSPDDIPVVVGVGS